MAAADAGDGAMSRTAFVTGAYGLLGAWLTRELVARGDRVVVLQRDRAPRSSSALARWEATKPWPPVTSARVIGAPRLASRGSTAARRSPRGR